MNLRLANPAASSVVMSAVASGVLSFLIVFGVTQDCSPGAVAVFAGLALASPFLLLPAAVLAVMASRRPVNRFSRLSRLLLGLDAALLLALLTFLYA